MKSLSVSELEREVRALTVDRALKFGLTKRAEDITVVVRIKNRSKAHDEWSTKITSKDWGEILALDWSESARNVLKALKKSGNKPLTGAEVRETGVEITGFPVLQEFRDRFRLAFLPFSFSPLSKLPTYRRVTDGRYRLFNKRPDVK